jgi:hypothetical protein
MQCPELYSYEVRFVICAKENVYELYHQGTTQTRVVRVRSPYHSHQATARGTHKASSWYNYFSHNEVQIKSKTERVCTQLLG